MTGRDSCLKPHLTKRRGTVRNLKWLRERLIDRLDAVETVMKAPIIGVGAQTCFWRCRSLWTAYARSRPTVRPFGMKASPITVSNGSPSCAWRNAANSFRPSANDCAAGPTRT